MLNNFIALNQNQGSLSSADFNRSPSNNQEILSQFEQERKRNRQQLERMIERKPLFEHYYLQTLCKAVCLDLFDASGSLFSYYQLSALIQVTMFAILHAVIVRKVKTSEEFEIEFETEFKTDWHLLKAIYNSELDLYEIELTHKATGVVFGMPHANVNDFDKIMHIITVQAEA